MFAPKYVGMSSVRFTSQTEKLLCILLLPPVMKLTAPCWLAFFLFLSCSFWNNRRPHFHKRIHNRSCFNLQGLFFTSFVQECWEMWMGNSLNNVLHLHRWAKVWSVRERESHEPLHFSLPCTTVSAYALLSTHIISTLMEVLCFLPCLFFFPPSFSASLLLPLHMLSCHSSCHNMCLYSTCNLHLSCCLFLLFFFRFYIIPYFAPHVFTCGVSFK